MHTRLHVGQYLLHLELVGGVGAAGSVGVTGAAVELWELWEQLELRELGEQLVLQALTRPNPPSQY